MWLEMSTLILVSPLKINKHEVPKFRYTILEVLKASSLVYNTYRYIKIIFFILRKYFFKTSVQAKTTKKIVLRLTCTDCKAVHL